jgi:DNA-binding response OmpR family regulator
MQDPNRKRILYVDDDIDSYEILRFYLTTMDLVHAQTISEGMRIAQSQSFAVYLFDQRLADGTGIELCQRIRLTDRQTPILILSGDAREVTRQQALQAGAQNFLTKPINFEQLTNLLNRFMNHPES